MAATMASSSSQFSEDGKYFAQLTAEGKLKIWNALTNTFEQEFTPDYHLTTPCTCLHFLQTNQTKYKDGSPKKKKRRDSDTTNPKLLLGTTNGLLLIYSITKGNLETTITSDTNQSINCLTVSSNTVFSGCDQQVIAWDVTDTKKVLYKWKIGTEKITAILAIPDSENILTAAKNIKLWNTETKEVLKTFTGHKSEVIYLCLVQQPLNNDTYFISASKGDRTLSCWSLNQNSSSKTATTTFLMEDIVQNVTINSDNNTGATLLGVTVRSGVVHIYKHTLNGHFAKPIKPKTTIQVVTDDRDRVTPIRIAGSFFLDHKTIRIGHGNEVMLHFEHLSIDVTKKLQCIVRQDPAKFKPPNSRDSVSKLKTPVVNDEVDYLTPQTGEMGTAKRKLDQNFDIPMEKRLENLTLTNNDKGKVPKADNVAQLLIQGLHSKDKKILKTVLYQKNEDVVRNTVRRLPVAVLVPFLKELGGYLQGKTLSSQVGAVWLRWLLHAHAGVLVSNPELPELLGGILGSVQSRLGLAVQLNRLKGRLDLLVPQMDCADGREEEENREALLVYNDRDTSDSDEEELQIDAQTDSDSEWEEESDLEGQIEENNVESGSENEAMSS